MSSDYQAIKRFMQTHYRHFNAKAVVEAAEGWVDQLQQGNKMFVTLAGAMSTAELGISLADLIRQDKVHAITCTAANLEEDVFNLVANKTYKRIPNWRNLTPEQEMELYEGGYNRVTDTCIPEAAMHSVFDAAHDEWVKADARSESKFPHEFLFDVLLSGVLEKDYQIDPKNSWLLAAAERKLPVFVPGWADSTLGNMFVAAHIRGEIKRIETVNSGLHYMKELVAWYEETTQKTRVGFFQIGGGIAGDFPICVVPLIKQDLKKKDVRLWSYFCQITDATTSYGGYSGAIPSEKITWGKLDTKCPKFLIESDATIVAPLIFAHVLAS